MGKTLKNGLNKTDVSIVLKCALNIKGLNFRDLARFTGISPSSISGYVTGANLPSEENWDKICRVLQIPATWNEICNSEDFTDEPNRGLYVTTEMAHKEERRKNWIQMFFALGYREGDIHSYVDDFVDWHADAKFDDAINECFAKRMTYL